MIGCDTNAHYQIWGGTNSYTYGKHFNDKVNYNLKVSLCSETKIRI